MLPMDSFSRRTRRSFDPSTRFTPALRRSLPVDEGRPHDERDEPPDDEDPGVCHERDRRAAP